MYTVEQQTNIVKNLEAEAKLYRKNIDHILEKEMPELQKRADELAIKYQTAIDKIQIEMDRLLEMEDNITIDKSKNEL